MRSPPPVVVSVGRACGITGLFLAFQIACAIPVTVVLMVLHGGDTTQAQSGLPLVLLIGNSLAAWMVLSLELRRQKLPWRFAPPARASFAWMLLPTLIATVGTSLVGGATLQGLSSLFPAIFEDTTGLEGLFDLAAHPVTIPLTLVVVAPLTEETIFRALILGGLLRTRRPAIAILLSAALFAGLHLNPVQLPTTFLIGLVYGWIYHRTRSLGLCIVAHMVNNGMALLATAHALNVEGTPDAVEPLAFPTLLALGLAILAVGVALIHRFTPRPAPETPPPLPPPPSIPPPVPPSPPQSVTA